MTYSFLRKYFEDNEFNEIKKDKEMYKFDFEKVSKDKETYKFDFEEVSRQHLELVTKINEKTFLEEKAFEINDNYPRKNVFYLGRKLVTKKINSLITCDVKNFITPNDGVIRELIIKNDLKVINPLKCNKDIIKIYDFCRKGSVYNFDHVMFTKNEVWLFPFEFLYLGKRGDCEDNSHLIVSMLIGAGVPAFRVRVVCGLCKYGGHSTVYVLGDDLKTWYHINSTGFDKFTDLTHYPKSRDVADNFGIHSVWFSFNNEFAWNSFETPLSTNSFKEVTNDFIKIV